MEPLPKFPPHAERPARGGFDRIRLADDERPHFRRRRRDGNRSISARSASRGGLARGVAVACVCLLAIQSDACRVRRSPIRFYQLAAVPSAIQKLSYSEPGLRLV